MSRLAMGILMVACATAVAILINIPPYGKWDYLWYLYVAGVGTWGLDEISKHIRGE